MQKWYHVLLTNAPSYVQNAVFVCTHELIRGYYDARGKTLSAALRHAGRLSSSA